MHKRARYAAHTLPSSGAQPEEEVLRDISITWSDTQEDVEAQVAQLSGGPGRLPGTRSGNEPSGPGCLPGTRPANLPRGPGCLPGTLWGAQPEEEVSPTEEDSEEDHTDAQRR